MANLKPWIFGLVFLLCIATAMAIDHNASSINVVIGTYTDGNVTSTWVLGDGGTYNWSGVAVTPGYEVRFNFSDVTSEKGSYGLNIYGSTSEADHSVGIELYNFTGNTWDIFIIATVPVGYSWANITFSSQNYLSGDVVWARAVHLDKGSPTEDFTIDFMRLTESDLTVMEEIFEIGSCPIDDLPTTIMYIFIGMLLLGFIVFAEYTNVPGLSLIAGLIGIFYSFPMWGCQWIYGAMIMLTSVVYMLWGLKWKWQ